MDRAVASPLSRARRTAELALGESPAGMLARDPGLMEIAHGTWEGLLAAQIRERDPERLGAGSDPPHEVLTPAGASLQHVFDRASPALARTVEAHAAADTVQVCTPTAA